MITAVVIVLLLFALYPEVMTTGVRSLYKKIRAWMKKKNDH